MMSPRTWTGQQMSSTDVVNCPRCRTWTRPEVRGVPHVPSKNTSAPNGAHRDCHRCAGLDAGRRSRQHGIGRSNPAHTGCLPNTPVVPPVSVPPVSVPPVVVPSVSVLGVVAEAPVSALGVVAEAANPLPMAARAGQADTSGQLALGGLTGFAAFLLLGAGFGLRRRHGVA